MCRDVPVDQGQALGSVIGIQRKGSGFQGWVCRHLLETTNALWFAIAPRAIFCPKLFQAQRDSPALEISFLGMFGTRLYRLPILY